MPLRASAHAPSGRSATASTALVLRSTLRALLVTCCRRGPLLRACAFQIFRRSFFYFVIFRIFFFLQAKSFFHLLQFFPLKSLGFVFSGSTFVHVGITHRFHQLGSHGNHLFAGLPQNFFFQLFKLAYISVFFKAWDLAFIFFNLFFFHHTTGLLDVVLAGTGCRRHCLLILVRRFKRRI